MPYILFYLYHQKTDGNKAKQQSREHRAIQRRLQSAVCNEEFGDLLKFNQLMVRKSKDPSSLYLLTCLISFNFLISFRRREKSKAGFIES